MQVPLTALPYRPSSSLTGDERCLYRASNVKTRGLGAANQYLEAYYGSLSMSEPIPSSNLTGTLAFSPSSTTVTGTGTSFLDELHIGQFIQADDEVLVVKSITSNTVFICARTPVTTETTATGTRLPNLFELDVKRASLLTGNGLHYDKGTILAVGSGVLYVNGAVLPGDSLTATRSAQVALYDSATGNYDVQPVGFSASPDTPNSKITIAGTGTAMSLGYYSFKLAYYSDITSGYGNPSAAILSGGTAGYNITAANQAFTINFDTTSAPPAKATGYIIYATAFSGSSAISAVNAIEGPWYELRRVPFTELSGGVYTGSLVFDYVDNDLSTTIALEDNDPPPDAEFVGSVTGYTLLFSTNGRGVNTSGREDTTSPGPFISPMKSSSALDFNFDAFPQTVEYLVPTEKGENIIGVVNGAGRSYVMTPNTLQAVTPTGLPIAPFTCRPFWKRGFLNPYNLIFVDDVLYGFSGSKAFRSIATGDAGSESFEFASDVESQMMAWDGAYVLIGHDPKNEEICYFSSAVRQNAEGYWETDIYPYSLTKYQWQPVVTLSSTTRDMIVSGVATVNGRLYFVAGGRRSGTTNQYDTWMYDEPSSADVPWYVAWSLSDSGVEYIPKILSRPRIRGKLTDATLQIFGATPDSSVEVGDLETGDNALATVTLDNTTEVTTYAIAKRKVKDLLMWTARIEGTSNYTGTGTVDQVHEIICDLNPAGQHR